MIVDWSPLKTEMVIWRRHNLPLPLWWRDDDAVAATPALDRLAQLATQAAMPIHVAVIPDLLTPSLPPLLGANPMLVPVVHGFRHISHAPEGGKNAEFGHPRPAASEETEQALQKMQQSFGADLLPLFVPPWNRITADLLPILAAQGYRGVSTYGPRTSTQPVPGLTRINTHIDPIYWRGHRGLVAPDELIAGLTANLQARRAGDTDPSEPLGLLTHHLVHTEDVWSFSRDIILFLLENGAVPADLRTMI
ncbi:polysaccharide deacetylase family protein [uncultured Sulfitobacter sp.]|uniref:polysaccharide deacetylase family protein n=1 Tax=uncultured Sulfitobacter sp. TaxID=191468 RepID=UPI002624BEC2|nr:polysaccharide deacetylase family protein [uncultured Sulfitobacter sp.]